MYSAVVQLEPPAVEPLSVELARRHCRIDHLDDDALLKDFYIPAARQMAETYLGRTLITQTLRWISAHAEPPRAAWPMVPLNGALLIPPLWYNGDLMSHRATVIPCAPLQEVLSVKTGRWGEDDTTLIPGTDYDVDAVQQPGRLRLHHHSRIGHHDHISVDFIAGYGDEPTDIPTPIVTGVMWLVAYLYENRGDAAVDLPRPAQMILNPYRLVTFRG